MIAMVFNTTTEAFIVGHGGGSVLGRGPCIRKVAGLNPTLATK